MSQGVRTSPVLKDISFDVQPGEIVGLIGLNGAGKSTTIKHIIGLLEASKGTIEINHLSLKKNTEEYRKQIGYIPETPSLYEELTLREHIRSHCDGLRYTYGYSNEKSRKVVGDFSVI